MTREQKKRVPLSRFGAKGYLGERRGQMVRGLIEDGFVRILWREAGQRRQVSWPNTEDGRELARAYGKGVAERLAQLADDLGQVRPVYQALTVRALWEAYWTAEGDDKRTATATSYRQHWRKFEDFFGEDSIAASLTREHLDLFKRELRALGIVPNQIKATIGQVKRVYRWASLERDLLPPTKVVNYTPKFALNERALEPGEYTRDEATRILAHFDPRNPRRWRPFVLTVLFAYAGNRQTATRLLTWADVALAPPAWDAAAGAWTYPGTMLRWDPDNDKRGKERLQPVPDLVAEALWVAYGWRCAYGYAGPYVFFRPAQARLEGVATARPWSSARRQARAQAVADVPWTYSAYHAQLCAAETAAGVAHRDFRAAHGFRRLVLRDVYDRTKDLKLAGEYIGDTDLKTLNRSYLRARPELLAPVAAAFDAAEAATARRANGNRDAIEAANDEAPLVGGASQPVDTEGLV